tara:strand:- start:109 stop:315 length:207 start_codon:yes stop_codon:yes gene_type:complete
MTQPEALALADILDRSVLQAHADAAAELRRLHLVNQELLATLKLLASHAKWLNVTTDSSILKFERTTT